MKKSLFMMGVAIAALSSCTQNEVLDIAESNTIQFGKSYIGKPTRANIISVESELNSFYVLGYQYKESPEAMWTTAENVYYVLDTWKYNNIKKYDTNYSYFFAAYSNAGINGEGSGNLETGATATFSEPTGKEADKKTLSLTIDNYSAATNNDLLVAISESNLTADNQMVSFGFKHALSQVNFILKNPLGNNPIVINSFSVTGLIDNGKLTYIPEQVNTTIEQIKWEFPDDPSETYGTARTISGLDVTEANETQNATGTYTVIPQNQKALTVDITATLYKNGDTGAGEQQTLQAIIPANSIPDGAFKPGYIYNFNATLNMGYIYFDDITVEEWVPSTPDTEMTPEVQP